MFFLLFFLFTSTARAEFEKPPSAEPTRPRVPVCGTGAATSFAHVIAPELWVTTVYARRNGPYSREGTMYFDLNWGVRISNVKIYVDEYDRLRVSYPSILRSNGRRRNVFGVWSQERDEANIRRSLEIKERLDDFLLRYFLSLGGATEKK